MAQPALHQVEGNPFFDTGHAKAMPQPFGARLGTGDPGACHDLDDAGVGGFQAPRPEIRPGGAVAETMDQIERIEKRGRHGHGAIDAQATFLPTLKREDRRLEIHPIGRECQGLRGATARIQQRPAIGADLAGCGFGGGTERGPLGSGEIEAVAVGS